MGPKNGSSSDSCPEDSDRYDCEIGWEAAMFFGFLALGLVLVGLVLGGAGVSESVSVRLWRWARVVLGGDGG